MEQTSKENLSIIVQAQNEEDTIAKLIWELKLLAPYEIIIVVNGSTDSTASIAATMNCMVIHYDSPLGINIGKAIGIRQAKGDILLITDGDIVIRSEQLRSFIEAIKNGFDVALNDLSWSMYKKSKPHPTAICKRALNIFLRREDLKVNAFGAIPFALNRKAVDAIGWWNFADPPMAQAVAVFKKLRITSPESVDVITTNKIRPRQHRTLAKNSPYPRSTSRIIGDHLRAMKYIIDEKGPSDGKERDRLTGYENTTRLTNPVKYSAIISIEKDPIPKNISNLIKRLKKLEIDEIIVVGYLLEHNFVNQLKAAGSIVINLSLPTRFFTYRAIGTAACTGECILFLDGHRTYLQRHIIPFLKAIDNQEADIALNNMKHLLLSKKPIEDFDTVNYFLNLSVKRPDLFCNSLYSTPHAIHRRVIDKLGTECLSIPPLAQTLAIHNGFKIKSPYSCKLNPQKNPDIISIETILVDHLNAFQPHLNCTNERGGFTDGKKNRKLVEELKQLDKT